jgi:uncharacterized protein
MPAHCAMQPAMRAVDRLRALWLRWDRVVLALILLLPLTVAVGLGFLWLFERGWLLIYLAATVAFFILIRTLRWLVRRRPTTPPPIGAVIGGVKPSVDWGAAERAVYSRAQAQIRAGLAKTMAWDALPTRALSVVESVAADLSGGKRGALDFTAPEALLLIGRLAERYRGILIRQVPFADRLSLQALWWVWQRQDTARAAAQGGWMVWRGVRLLINPAAALLREAERVLASGLQDRLGAAVTRDLQARLLDEAAQAAIDLYSGRLRFTDAELAGVVLPDMRRDALTPDDPPLRVLLVGQVSAGKSSLVNALAGDDAAETDAAPVTDRAAAVETWLAGVPVRLVDTPGLTGDGRRRDTVATEAAEADLILWVLRADRPDRAPDHDLRRVLDARLARMSDRRPPPVVSVVAAADLLVPGWPFPEHRLPPEARHRLGDALVALSEDWPDAAIPVSVEPVEWNLDALEAALAAALPEARQVQRQRRRLQGGRMKAGETLTRAGRGMRSVAGVVASAVADRFRRGPRER